MSVNTNMVRVKTQDPNTKGSKECYLLGDKNKKNKKKRILFYNDSSHSYLIFFFFQNTSLSFSE